jgi:hypothetical protein
VPGPPPPAGAPHREQRQGPSLASLASLADLADALSSRHPIFADVIREKVATLPPDHPDLKDLWRYHELLGAGGWK